MSTQLPLEAGWSARAGGAQGWTRGEAGFQEGAAGEIGASLCSVDSADAMRAKENLLYLGISAPCETRGLAAKPPPFCIYCSGPLMSV